MRDGGIVPNILYLGPEQRRVFSCFMFLSIYSQVKETLVKEDYVHKVPLLCMTIFSPCLTNVVVFLPQLHDISD
jgi:hypothetical protein